SHGWDLTSRNDPEEPWPLERWGWPWEHVVTGNTPERFGDLVYAAREFLGTCRRDSDNVLVLNAWNEWTEGSVLAPTVDEGDAVLRALQASLTR
ncbi:MAG: glycoside hydrolase family 99-like domain-containing protein, partial [Phycisphaeraceae bacterium]|nr:glycoside hydrolase family 99-like domain-containing protein [Phycisphaeraceae bacterium]